MGVFTAGRGADTLRCHPSGVRGKTNQSGGCDVDGRRMLVSSRGAEGLAGLQGVEVAQWR